MAVPAFFRQPATGPVVHVGAVFQRLADMLGHDTASDAAKTLGGRSVADLLEFGYIVTAADHHFPHKAA